MKTEPITKMNKRFRQISLALAASLVSLASWAATPLVSCKNSGDTELPKLARFFKIGDMRAYYLLEGDSANPEVNRHALPPLLAVPLPAERPERDNLGSPVPAYIYDTVISGQTFRDLIRSLGYRDPLNSARFREANAIDLNFMDMAVYHREDGRQVAMSAGSAIRRWDNVPTREGKCAISVAINVKFMNPDGTLKDPQTRINTIKGGGLAHEIFHLVQYSYTKIPSHNFGEGTADWALDGISDGFEGNMNVVRTVSAWVPDIGDTSTFRGNYNRALPGFKPTRAEQIAELNTKVIQVPDSAERYFWKRLGHLTSLMGNARINLTPSVRDAKYADGTAVVKNDVFIGHAFMLKVLQNLDAEDDIVSHRHQYAAGWKLFDWGRAAPVPAYTPEEIQNFDFRVLRIAQRVLRDMAPTFVKYVGRPSVDAPANLLSTEVAELEAEVSSFLAIDFDALVGEAW